MGGVGLLLSAAYLGATAELPFGHLDQPGAGVFPALAGCILIASSLITIWEGWRLDPGIRTDMPRGADLKRLLACVGLLLGFLVTLPFLGLLISSTIFCMVLMRILSELAWPWIVAISLAMCGGLYVVFVFLLKVPMPLGLLAP
jgi:putative tricarboxylic transport membrane protein